MASLSTAHLAALTALSAARNDEAAIAEVYAAHFDPLNELAAGAYGCVVQLSVMRFLSKIKGRGSSSVAEESIGAAVSSAMHQVSPSVDATPPPIENVSTTSSVPPTPSAASQPSAPLPPSATAEAIPAAPSILARPLEQAAPSTATHTDRTASGQPLRSSTIRAHYAPSSASAAIEDPPMIMDLDAQMEPPASLAAQKGKAKAKKASAPPPASPPPSGGRDMGGARTAPAPVGQSSARRGDRIIAPAKATRANAAQPGGEGEDKAEGGGAVQSRTDLAQTTKGRKKIQSSRPQGSRRTSPPPALNDPPCTLCKTLDKDCIKRNSKASTGHACAHCHKKKSRCSLAHVPTTPDLGPVADTQAPSDSEPVPLSAGEPHVRPWGVVNPVILAALPASLSHLAGQVTEMNKTFSLLPQLMNSIDALQGQLFKDAPAQSLQSFGQPPIGLSIRQPSPAMSRAPPQSVHSRDGSPTSQQSRKRRHVEIDSSDGVGALPALGGAPPPVAVTSGGYHHAFPHLRTSGSGPGSLHVPMTTSVSGRRSTSSPATERTWPGAAHLRPTARSAHTLRNASSGDSAAAMDVDQPLEG